MIRKITIIDIFESFAADFEATLRDDNWSRLKKYFTPEATYKNVGDSNSECRGQEDILSYLKTDVSTFDRKFDSRNLIALNPPEIKENQLSRKWQTTFTLKGTPDLIIEGEARYFFEGKLIKGIEEEITPESLQKLDQWLKVYGIKLQS